MSPRAWEAYVQDILDAIREIISFMEKIDFDTFRQDVKTIGPVDLNLIIIGEAANTIPDQIQ
jgi:uncharacterized protein with HEPN domain